MIILMEVAVVLQQRSARSGWVYVYKVVMLSGRYVGNDGIHWGVERKIANNLRRSRSSLFPRHLYLEIIEMEYTVCVRKDKPER